MLAIAALTSCILPSAISYNFLNLLMKSFCSGPASVILDFKLFNLFFRFGSAFLPKHFALIALNKFWYLFLKSLQELIESILLRLFDLLMIMKFVVVHSHYYPLYK